MKTLPPIIAALLLMMSLPAAAVADHQYAPVGASQKQPFDVYTDGKNTYIEAVKGLQVRDAVREGDSFVVRGVADRFVVQLNGKSMVIARTGLFTQSVAVAIPPYEQSPVSAQEVSAGARLTMIDEERAKLQQEVRAQVSALVLAELQTQLHEAKTAASQVTPQIDPTNTGDAKSEPMTPSPIAFPDMTEKSAAPEKLATSAPASPAQRAASDAPAPPEIERKFDVNAVHTVAATVTPVPAPPVPTVITTIKKGALIHEGLKQRAQADGWTFLWYPNISWEAIGDIDLTRYKNADEAVDDIVTVLREEGKPIQLRISDGNKIMEVLSTEVKYD